MKTLMGYPVKTSRYDRQFLTIKKTNGHWALTKLFKKQNTYTFRGPINFDHLVNDCIRDGKHAFMTVSEAVYIGISRQLPRFMLEVPVDHAFLSGCCSFNIIKISKKDISKVVPFLQKVESLIKKNDRKIAKAIAKDKKAGKFSFQPETRVSVF